MCYTTVHGSQLLNTTIHGYQYGAYGTSHPRPVYGAERNVTDRIRHRKWSFTVSVINVLGY